MTAAVVGAADGITENGFFSHSLERLVPEEFAAILALSR